MIFVIFTIFLAIGAFGAALGQYLHVEGGGGNISNVIVASNFPTPSPYPLVLLPPTNTERDGGEDTIIGDPNSHHHHENRKPRQPIDWEKQQDQEADDQEADAEAEDSTTAGGGGDSVRR